MIMEVNWDTDHFTAEIQNLDLVGTGKTAQEAVNDLLNLAYEVAALYEELI